MAFSNRVCFFKSDDHLIFKEHLDPVPVSLDNLIKARYVSFRLCNLDFLSLFLLFLFRLPLAHTEDWRALAEACEDYVLVTVQRLQLLAEFPAEGIGLDFQIQGKVVF